MAHSFPSSPSPRRHGRSFFTAFSLFSLFSVALLALAACGGGGSGGTNGPTKGGTLNVSLANDLNTLDPLQSGLVVERQVMFNMYEPLVQVDANNNIKADLATDWKYTDPKTLVFTLRSGVSFQDGTPFNADAVVFNINRILKAGNSSQRFGEISSIASVTAVDTTHVQFNLSKPFSPLLAALTDRAGMMLSPTAIQAGGANFANNPVNAGTGPFIFKQWVKSDHLTLTKNPKYWGKDSSGNALPYLDGVNYKIITDGSVAYTNLAANTTQAADGISAQSLGQAKGNSSLTVKQIPALSFFGMMLNTKSAPLDNVHVRRAISFAVDRQEILHSVLLDNGVVANGPLSPASWAYDASIAPYTHDINQAKAELAQSGLPSPVTFTLLIASGSAATQQEAQFVQSELQPAGITVNITPEPFNTVTLDTRAHKYQAAFVGWSGRPDPDGNMYNWFHTGGGFNDAQYSNADVDTALEDARVQTDQATRAKDYQNAEKLLLQDAPYVFINHGLSSQLTSAKVQNFTLLPTGIMVFTQVYLNK